MSINFHICAYFAKISTFSDEKIYLPSVKILSYRVSESNAATIRDRWYIPVHLQFDLIVFQFLRAECPGASWVQNATRSCHKLWEEQKTEPAIPTDRISLVEYNTVQTFCTYNRDIYNGASLFTKSHYDVTIKHN